MSASEARLRRRACAGLLLAAGALPATRVPLRADEAATTRRELIERPSAANEAIERLSRRARISPGGTRPRLDLIVDQIFSTSGLGFTYEARRTLTAAEAAEARSGNCLSLVNLFVAIARSAGIDANYVRVEDFETFYRYEGTIVHSTHVVGGVEVSGRLLTVDFLPHRAKRYRQLRPISDGMAAILYYNAIANEAMLAGELEGAEAGFRSALEIDPDVAETWNNYAILQHRRDDLEGALASLETAHRLDPELLPAIENLAGFYRLSGQREKAAEFARLALERKTANPYFLLQQSLRHLAAGELDEAERLLTKARRAEPAEPELFLALGRVELERGNAKAASRYFDQARRKSATYAAGFQRQLQRKIDRLLAPGGDDDR